VEEKAKKIGEKSFDDYWRCFMKVLVGYIGKYGSTKMYAQELVKAFGDDSLSLDLKDTKGLDLSEWDSVILGSGIYMGKVPRGLKSFCKRHLKALKDKRSGLFVCCASKAGDSQTNEYFEKNFPSELLEQAKVKKVFPGGQVMNEKAGFIYKKMFDQMKILPEEEIRELVDEAVKDFSG